MTAIPIKDLAKRVMDDYNAAMDEQDRIKQRPWVGLTKDEAAECWSTSAVKTWSAIEAKLKEKNT